MNARLGGALAAMVALLAAGLTTGTRIYYYLLALLALMLVYSLACVLWTLATAKVAIKGVRPRVLRGESLMTILTVEHASLLQPGSFRVVLSVPGGSIMRQEISVEAPLFAQRSFRHVVRCPHRGSYELGVSRIAASDVFGLFCLSRSAGKKLLRVEVCPRPRDMQPMELRATDVGPEFRSRATEDTASPSDTRKWQEVDELKKVHWKLSLRRQEMMVRTFEESARPDTLIIPDMSQVTALQDQRLTIEDCICEVALGAAKAQLEASYPVRMPLETKRPQELSGRSAADISAFADALMRTDFDSPYPYEQVLTLIQRRMQRTGGAILVSSRLTTRTADIAMRMQQTGMQVKFIWVTDAPRDDALEMLECMKMAGVQVQTADPWLLPAASEV